MTTTVRALLVGKVNDVWTRRIDDVSVDSLGDGDVLVKVDWSC
ncbi:MAG: oxidoreductase, partial [Actinobacteria bacterium]|nr:oxidoreductase [Actinomycetota bacterium]